MSFMRKVFKAEFSRLLFLDIGYESICLHFSTQITKWQLPYTSDVARPLCYKTKTKTTFFQDQDRSGQDQDQDHFFKTKTAFLLKIIKLLTQNHWLSQKF